MSHTIKLVLIILVAYFREVSKQPLFFLRKIKDEMLVLTMLLEIYSEAVKECRSVFMNLKNRNDVCSKNDRWVQGGGLDNTEDQI